VDGIRLEGLLFEFEFHEVTEESGGMSKVKGRGGLLGRFFSFPYFFLFFPSCQRDSLQLPVFLISPAFGIVVKTNRIFGSAWLPMFQAKQSV
jgi:hypothetical protein